MDINNTENKNRQQRALELLRRAAQELNPQSNLNAVFLHTVKLASELMESVGKTTRYFSHIAVKEGDRLFFDPHHNLPEIQSMLVNSLGPGAEIDLTGRNNKPIGITGYAALKKEIQNIANVRQHPDYIDLKNAGGSQLATPIMVDGEVYAILNIEHESTNAFDDQDEQTMLALASIVSAVIDSKENASALQALFNSVRALTSTFEFNLRLQTVLDEVARQAYELMALRSRKPGTFAHVGIVAGKELKYVSAEPREILTRFGEETYATIDLTLHKTYDNQGNRRRIGVSGYAIISGEIQNVANVDEHEEYLRVDLDAAATQGERTINSQLAVPIKLPNDEVVGVISIDRPTFGEFSSEDVKNVKLLAEIAAEAYRIKRMNEQQTRALDVLQRSAMSITDNMTIDAILAETMRQARTMVERDYSDARDYVSHIGVRDGNWLIFQEQHNDPVVYKAFRLCKGDKINFVNPEADYRIGIVGRAARTQKTQLIPNVNVDPDYFTVWPSGTQLSVPIFVSNELFAILSVEHNKPNYFNEEDKATIEALASQVGAVLSILKARLDRVRLDERDIQRRNFISNVSHELRTPLVQIAWFLKALERGLYGSFNDSDYQHNLIGAVRSVEDQEEIVNQLLEEAESEPENLTLKLSEYSVYTLIEEVIEQYYDRAAMKGIDVQYSIEAGEILVKLDRGRIKRVLSNLVGNALKYTDTGTISVRVYSNDGHLIIEVEDTGMGIAADEQHRIFDRSARAENAIMSERDGLGLGLHIAKKYTQLHGGEIKLARSELGKGSCFVIRLPIAGPKSEEVNYDNRQA